MSRYELSRHELRRQLKDIDRLNRDTMPAWRDALHRIFSRDSQLTTEEKAALLGVPSPGRRQLFKLGGASLLGVAVLAACGDDSESESGATSTSSAPAPAQGGVDDLTLARTAASLEQLAIDVYGNQDAAALVTTAAVRDAAMLFSEHHTAHRDALNAVIEQNGGNAVQTANAAVFKALVEPALPNLKSEADVVMLAYDLESAAAQTYVFAGGALGTPDLRSTIMTIGGIEARHAAVLKMAALASPPAEVFPENRAFFPGDNPLQGIEGALITG